jgi:hypothetical protein
LADGHESKNPVANAASAYSMSSSSWTVERQWDLQRLACSGLEQQDLGLPTRSPVGVDGELSPKPVVAEWADASGVFGKGLGDLSQRLSARCPVVDAVKATSQSRPTNSAAKSR